jgi:hypothetical protein
MNHEATNRRTIAADLETFADDADRLGDAIDAWHWRAVGGIVVAPFNHSAEVHRAQEEITAAAGRLRRAARYHAESADRIEETRP